MNGFFQWLIHADINLFLTLNGFHNTFFDTIMYWVSNRWIWIPLYVWIFFRLTRLYEKKVIRIILFIILFITASDQISSRVIKNFVERPRPCHEAALEGRVHIVNNYCGGEFGFVSSHAANCFALLSFLFLLTRKKEKLMIKILLAWAIIVSYSRIYLGVHYPGDIICGALSGIFIGSIFSMIYFRIGTKL